ncbi:hypothetical protein ACFFJT_14170 [Dyella flava]|uniref:Uncharacterized protein n=1 Tax=Dyella flava TaxID=1920170 RepID=A0ABS2K2U7_9GAMM|nr:hypothetical protein [Dyella flava]MBM7125098.1 hypothetical protein [Dyella flava]GLQ51971.1 hypothetical protein GCM10010872_34200 [Dyella flava]
MDRRKTALVLCLLPACAMAQRAIPENDYNIWLLEKPVPAAPLLTARIAGVASYQHFQSGATLAFSCRPDGAGIGVELAVGAQALGFDTDPYEGPDATTNGPVTVISGKARGVQLRVSGFYGDGGSFDTGTPFVFAFRPTTAQVLPWTADTVRGQSLRVLVPAAKAGAPMTAEFRWPVDNSVFKRVVMPCVDAAALKRAR